MYNDVVDATLEANFLQLVSLQRRTGGVARSGNEREEVCVCLVHVCVLDRQEYTG